MDQENQNTSIDNQQATTDALASAPAQSDKSYVGMIMLSYLVGMFGVDRFLLGRKVTGVLKLLTFGGLLVWWVIDWGLITYGKLRGKDGLELQGYAANQKFFKKLFWILLALEILATAAVIAFHALVPEAGQV
ncbi:MAG: hypothetical protein JWL85_243 [Candidatus Saccharibacteria bacterium]|nr:hypothetical protein [Candidatus Saccharibacteria bacterium]